MKTIFTFALLALPFLGFSQIDVSGTIDDKANEKLGDAIDGVWSAPGKMRDKKKEKTDNQQTTTTSGDTTKSTTPTTTTTTTTASPTNTTPTFKTYQNYDFVPGSELVFEDNFVSDQDGEFPAHWNLISGQAVVNKIDSKPTFCLTDGNYVKVEPNITTKEYLSNSFSVETDTYFSGGDYGLMFFFYQGADEKMSITLNASEVVSSFPAADGENNTGLNANLPVSQATENYYNKWHHIAIAYKDKQVKVYVDQTRVLVIPNCNFQPNSIQMGGIGSLENPIKFTGVRIANGANMNMLNKLNTDGKIITYGITFDVAKSTIKPESMGTINSIYKLMTDNPDLKLEVGGHCDSDGEDAYNLKLSQDRADAVRNQLITMGIDASRLTAKGYGETKPIAPNTTFEGKAKNRRVEFVKK
jgi:outer membrane protein OmpA-like peptidoglycan-associated protein